MNPNERPSTALVAVEGSNLPDTGEKKISYWGRVAARYTVAWRMLLLVLILFVVLFMLLFSRVFTYDSLFCFFRDLQSVSAFIPSDYDTVYATYEEGERMVLSYRGGVAFVNGGGVEIYSPDGRRLLDLDRPLQAPRAVASDKYLVAFDQGGTSFSVTNSYAELFHGETEFPILHAQVADSGHFALITASKDTLSQVLIYDNNFNLIQRMNRASATVSVSLSSNGKRIAVLGATAQEGILRSLLDVYRLGEVDPTYTLTIEGEFPLSVDFTDHRHLALLTDTQLRFCDLNGNVDVLLALEGTPVHYTVDRETVLLVLASNDVHGENRVLAFDEKGDSLYADTVQGNTIAVAVGDRELYLLLNGESVMRIDLAANTATTAAVESGAVDVIATKRGGARVGYPAKAECLIFEN